MASRTLTEFEQRTLDRLEAHDGRQRLGDGPWERAWVTPDTAAESRAMGRLYRLGLIDCRPGRVKVGARYRALSGPSGSQLP